VLYCSKSVGHVVIVGAVDCVVASRAVADTVCVFLRAIGVAAGAEYVGYGVIRRYVVRIFVCVGGSIARKKKKKKKKKSVIGNAGKLRPMLLLALDHTPAAWHFSAIVGAFYVRFPVLVSAGASQC
jgi:hypothetical protein